MFNREEYYKTQKGHLIRSILTDVGSVIVVIVPPASTIQGTVEVVWGDQSTGPRYFDNHVFNSIGDSAIFDLAQAQAYALATDGEPIGELADDWRRI